MAFNRRRFLQGLGAVSVLVVGGAVYRAVDQGVFSAGRGPAYAPWEDWRTRPVEGPLGLVQTAILAANPHNSQPWLFDVVEQDGATRIDLYADMTRNIGTVDPLLREMYMGVGCALENLLLAATVHGYAADVRYMPDGADPTLAASIVLQPAAPQASRLYDAIPNRHTNRGDYDRTQPVHAATLTAMAALNDCVDLAVVWLAEEATMQRFTRETVAATEVFAASEQQIDSDHWLRHDWQTMQSEASGLTYDAQLLGAPLTVLAKMGPQISAEQSGAYFVSGTQRHVASAAGFGLLAARNAHDHTQRLQGGRLWQRLHLWATNQGLAMQPLNQLCERADYEFVSGLEPRFTRVLADLVGDPAWHVLMPFRFGYPTLAAAPSPRRGVDAVLMTPIANADRDVL